MKLPENALAICIGEITAKALAARGVTGFRVAHTQNASGIAEIILEETKK
jgi:uroporphyrinogen-III synthase